MHPMPILQVFEQCPSVEPAKELRVTPTTFVVRSFFGILVLHEG